MWIVLTMLGLAQLPPLFPLAKIQPGMRGVCHTVFQGNQIEPFPFEVKQRIPNELGPQKDVVLVRLLGDKADLIGVASGMSGSPCFIEDRLVGALGYSFGGGFGKEPMAGITPIDDMLQVWRRVSVPLPWREMQQTAASSKTLPQDWQVLLGTAPIPVATASRLHDHATSGLQPMLTPVTLSGVPQVYQQRFADFFAGLGLQSHFSGSLQNSSQSASALSSQALQPAPIVPGAPLAMIMASGDLEIAATGTVTVVDGADVLAFGHPSQGYGTVSLPFAGAYIVHTLASLRHSFKMSVAGPIVGEIVQDRLSAIAGRIGQIPQMIPIRGELQVGVKKQHFSIDIARDRYLTPRLLFMALLKGLGEGNESDLRGTLRLHTTIEVGQEQLVWESVDSGERQDIFSQASFGIAHAFEMLWDHQYGPPPHMAVTVRGTLLPNPMVEQIEYVMVDRKLVKPGEKMVVGVGLRDELGTLRREQFVVHVPPTWADQTITLMAAGHHAAERLRIQQQGSPTLGQRSHVLASLQSRHTPGRLWLFVTGKTVGIGGVQRAYDFLPPSATLAWANPTARPLLRTGLLHHLEQSRAGIVQGEQSYTIRVGSRL